MKKNKLNPLTHERITQLAAAVGYAPWNAKDFELRVPTDVLSLFKEVKALQDKFDARDLPYTLHAGLFPREG